MTTQQYCIILENEKGYCILERGTLQNMREMLSWYKAHQPFFNGTFKLVEY